MSHGLLKRAGAFLLASAMVFSTASPGLAEDLGPDADAAEAVTEDNSVDTGAPGEAEATGEIMQPVSSYIICLPEGGAEYSYDAAHKSEEGSDEAFTILLYAEGEEVSIGVTAEQGFALYGADGNLFLEPEGGKFDFAMPAQDLQLIFDESQQEEAQEQPEAPVSPEEAESVEPGEMEELQEPEADSNQGTTDTEGEEAQPSDEGTPETEEMGPLTSLEWEASNVSVQARMTDGGSFPEGSALSVDTPDTAMEDEEGAMAYGKAVADALATLKPDTELWALYPFEVTLGDGAEFSAGQKEFSITFSDEEIVEAFQSGIRPEVATYAMDRETLTVSDADMVPAEDMDAYFTDDGKLSVDFLAKAGIFAIAFVKDPVDEADSEVEVEAESEAAETEAEATEVFGYENLRFTEDGYTLLKDADGTISSHTLIGLAADNLGTVPAASAEVSFRFALPEGMSAAEMQLTDGKAIAPDGEVCIELWKADDSLPAAITAVTADDGILEVTVTSDSEDGYADPLSGWELTLYGSALRSEAFMDEMRETNAVENADAAGMEDVGGAVDVVNEQILVSAHAVLMAPQRTDRTLPGEAVLEAASSILVRDDVDEGYDIMPIASPDEMDGCGIFAPDLSGCLPGNVEVGSGVTTDQTVFHAYTYRVESSSKVNEGWIRFPNSFWVYQADGSVKVKYDTKLYFWSGDSPNCRLLCYDGNWMTKSYWAAYSHSGSDGEVSKEPELQTIHTEWHFYEHGTDKEVSVNGKMGYYIDGSLTVTQGAIGPSSFNGEELLDAPAKFSFSSTPSAPLQFSLSESYDVGIYLRASDSGLLELRYHIKGVPDGQRFAVNDGDIEHILLESNTQEIADKLFPQLSYPGYEFDGWYSDAEYQDKYTGTESMQSDVDVYARFIKVQVGSINVTKTLDTKGWDVNDITEANKRFTFTLKGTSDASAAVNEQKDINGAGTALFENLPVGDYTLTEAYNAAVWESQMEGSGTVSVGQTAEAVCKNILKTGEVQVTKTLDTKGMDVGSIPEADKKFTFTLSGTSTAGIPVSKQVVINGAGTAKFEKIPVGTYTVTETCTGLWSAGAKQVNVTVTADHTAEASFKNTVNTGGVTVTKTLDTRDWDAGTIPDEKKKFTFTLNGRSDAGTDVSQQKEITGAGTVSFSDIPAGTYTITESCNTDVWSTQMDGSVTVTAGQAASVACKNTLKTGEVQVTKALDTKGLDAGSIKDADKTFTFTLSGTSTAGITVNKQVTVKGAGSAKFEKIPVGSYTVTETCTGLWKAEAAKQATVTDGQTAGVTFTNTLNTGSVTVTKTLDLKGWGDAAVPEAAKKFTFTLSGNSTAGIVVSKQAAITGAGKASFTDIPAGTYTITESCNTDAWSTQMEGSIKVVAGQAAQVACKNTLKTGEVQVTKTLDTKGMDADSIKDADKTFTFTLSGTSAAGITVSKQVTVKGAGSGKFEKVPVGTYTVTETCTGLWKAEAAKQVTVTDGKSAGVTFTNTLNTGSVTVNKTLDTKGWDAAAISEEAREFTFSLSGASDAGIAISQRKSVTGAGAVLFTDIPAGSYSITEACDTDVWNTQMESSVTVTAGQDAIVACRNTMKTGEVCITKALDAKGMDLDSITEEGKTFVFTLSGTSIAGIAVNKQVQIIGEGSAKFVQVPVGVYTVTEACDTGLWDSEGPKEAAVTDGKATDVTFKNTAATGSVSITKVMELKGVAEEEIPEENRKFVFTLSGSSAAGTEVNRQKEITGSGTAIFEDVPVGTYTVAETCDTAIWEAEGSRQVEVTDGKAADATFKNTLNTGSVVVTKLADLKGISPEAIPDESRTFTFVLSGMSSAGVEIKREKSVIGGGTVTFEDVPAGSYLVTEAYDADIWELKDAKSKRKATIEAGKTAEAAFENVLKTGSVRVVKELDTGDTDEKTIPEENKTFTFTLSGTSEAGIAVNRQATVIGAGAALLEDIPVGSYTVSESCNGNVWDMAEPEGGAGITVTYGQIAETAFRNILKAGDVLVSKTLDLKGRGTEAVPEENLTFTFVLSGTSEAGTAVNERQTVIGEGTARFEKIPAGTYTLTEECGTDMWDTQMENRVEVTDGQATEVECRNSLKAGDVIVSKTIDARGQEMAGFSREDLIFTFSLNGISTAGIAVDEQMSITGEGEARFENVPAGTYTVTEACNADIWDTRMESEVTVAPGQAAEVSCRNILKTGDIRVSMLQKDYKGNITPLDGIPLRLEDMQGNAVHVDQEEVAWVSKDGETGHLERIPAGDYMIVAESVPAGYVLPEALQIHVGYASEPQEFSVTADMINASVRAFDKETTRAVDGVRMDVLDKDGNAAYKDAALDWIQECVPAGIYTLRFTQVPDGYATPDDMEISVEETAGMQEYAVELSPTHIAVMAVDGETKQPVEGARMRLEDEDGKAVTEWASGKDWKYIARIAPGNYHIVTEKVPDGYEIPQDTQIEVKDMEEQQDYTVSLGKVPSAVSSPKTGDDLDVGRMAALIAAIAILLAAGTVFAVKDKKKRE